MNKRADHMHSRSSTSTGFSILEVLIGIFIFAVGLLALSSLQGALTRSMADAKVRTTAVNIAERAIEGQRGFTQIMSDTAVPPTFIAFNDIVDATVTETVNGITYTVATDVTDHYYDLTTDGFTTTAPTGAVHSTYKQVEVTVSWDAAQNFRGDEGTEISAADLGGGEITLTASIPAMVTSASARVADQSDGDTGAPPISYQPGENPDIISLSLGGSKFKESLTPEPEVYRLDELMETRFDVITYSQTDSGSLFLRREEFISVSCECTLKDPPGTPGDAGRRPTIWAGDEYEEAEYVNKPYGVSSLNVQTQSFYCDVCCQDHHDGGSHADDAETATTRYDPFPKSSRDYWGSGPFAGDHKHYYPNNLGVLTVVDRDGDTYLESCMLVRKDGFLRVTQDIRQEGVNGFPQDVLDDVSEVEVYSNYVTGAVSAYAAAVSPGYETSPPTLTPPAVGDAVDDLWSNETTLPLAMSGGLGLPSLLAEQQLRNRGIYIGYISNDLQYVLACLNDGGDVASCESGDVRLDQTGSANPLELLPFFDVQLTKLSRWNESPINNPVDTTNEAIISGNLHSRGVAYSGGRQGRSVVMAKGHPGNIGLTDIDPIEPNFTTTTAEVIVESSLGEPGLDPSTVIITGTITNAVGGALKVTNIMVESIDADCDRTPDGFVCAITGDSPTIKISGYGKATPSNLTNRRACSSNMVKLNESFTDINPWAIFSLAGLDQAFLYNINITTLDVCPTGGGIGG